MSIFGPGEKLTEQFVMQRDYQTLEKAKRYIKDPMITIWAEEIGSLKRAITNSPLEMVVTIRNLVM